eukprot:TRINITY_DN80633_c0_g1_i1.p1 TRINITY_DN80633_c0_g1~~TRINITY_DN80633_c0_g1_i1.p1  ORF type:complete len:266 (+),score=39.73 TRINITY_DN80633_c0_g1_i1:114-911(+)
MSDDQFLGRALCCIPNRIFCLLVAIWTFTAALVEASYLVFIKWMWQGRSLTPLHCAGHACTQVATCKGLNPGTYEITRAVMLIGGLVFGYLGISGAHLRHGSQLKAFSGFLLLKAGVIAVFAVIDAAYYYACSSYAWNVVAGSVLFWWPNWPMSEERKLEIVQGPRWFPDGFMQNDQIEQTIWPLYAAICIIHFGLLIYSANQVSYLAEHCSFGVFGLGANYEISKWRGEKLRKDRFNEFLEEAKEDIRLTFSDDPPPPSYYSMR